MQALAGLAPAAAIDKVVELRDAVLERAADAVAERYAAVHAPGRLADEDLVRIGYINLEIVARSLLAFLHPLERLAVIDRHHLHEPSDHVPPAIEYPFGPGAGGPLEMPLDHVAEKLDVLGLVDVFQVNHIEVAERVEQLVLVEDVRDPAAHTGCEVSPGAPEHDDPPGGHVFAPVVADTLDDRGDAAVADGESLARHAVDVRLASGRAVQEGVADDDVLVRRERRAGRGHHDDPSA